MNWMKKITALALVSVCSYAAQAQKAVGNPLFLHMHDKMVQVDKYNDILSGTVFVDSNWQLGAVLLENGTLVENVRIRINVLDDEIHYIDESGKEMVSTQNIKSVIFKKAGNDTTGVFVSKYAFSGKDAGMPGGWMQLLAKGKASLLKKYHKSIIESKGYSSATVEKNIVTEVRYFVWYNGELVRVKNVSEVAAAINNPAVDKQLSNMKKNGKSEMELKALVDYFNTL